MLGDQTFLHDLNSLALLKKGDYPLVLCVVNNGGGGIFSFLPIAGRNENFEEYWAASHAMQFAPAAALFDLPYFHPRSAAEMKGLLEEQKRAPRSCLIEITTNRAENVLLHKRINQEIEKCLHAASLPQEILSAPR